MMMQTASKIFVLDEAGVEDVHQRLVECIRRMGDLDRDRESRAVHQVLALMWAAHDALNLITKHHRTPRTWPHPITNR